MKPAKIIIIFFSLFLLTLTLDYYYSSTSETDPNQAFATSHVPIKVKQDQDGQIWDLYGNSTLVFTSGGSTPTQAWNENSQSWESYVLTDLGGGNFDVKSGLISTKFQGTSINHYNPDMTIFLAEETPKVMRFNQGSYDSIPLTFINRTASTSQEATPKTVRGILVNDNIETVRITET